MDIEKRKVGIRIESRYHEIEPDSSEAFCYFAEMLNAEAESCGETDGMCGDSFTSDEAAEIMRLVREIFEADDEKIELYTEGELYFGGGKFEVRYREPNEVTGMGESVTSISFDFDNRDMITITRGGDVYSALVLERGVRHTCAYNTDALPLIIYTTAKRIKNEMTQDGGVLDMIYVVEAQSGPAQYNRVTVNVTIRDSEEELER